MRRTYESNGSSSSLQGRRLSRRLSSRDAAWRLGVLAEGSASAGGLKCHASGRAGLRGPSQAGPPCRQAAPGGGVPPEAVAGRPHMKKRYSSARSRMKSTTRWRSARWSPPSPCRRPVSGGTGTWVGSSSPRRRSSAAGAGPRWLAAGRRVRHKQAWRPAPGPSRPAAPQDEQLQADARVQPVPRPPLVRHCPGPRPRRRSRPCGSAAACC